MNQADLLQVISGEDRSARARLLRAGLATAEPGYRLATALRNRLYDRGLRHAIRLPRPVISIGNLTTGGTGKTPLTVHLAQRLLDLGARPAVLTRGYRGGDEARQMRSELGDAVAVEANPDRAAAAAAVLRAVPRTSVFLLDDGFQHRGVARDLDLVLIDAMRPFGYGHVLPRGLMREPPRGLRRAGGVIITRADQVSPDDLAELDDRVANLSGEPPLAHVAFRWTAFRGTPRDMALSEVKGQRLALVSGIGNPAAFEAQAREVGDVVSHRVFDDHHAYTAAELASLLDQAAAADTAALLTTEKDWTKWSPLLEGQTPRLPILRPVLGVRFVEGGEALEALLRKTIAGRGTL